MGHPLARDRRSRRVAADVRGPCRRTRRRAGRRRHDLRLASLTKRLARRCWPMRLESRAAARDRSVDRGAAWYGTNATRRPGRFARARRPPGLADCTKAGAGRCLRRHMRCRSKRRFAAPPYTTGFLLLGVVLERLGDAGFGAQVEACAGPDRRSARLPSAAAWPPRTASKVPGGVAARELIGAVNGRTRGRGTGSRERRTFGRRAVGDVGRPCSARSDTGRRARQPATSVAMRRAQRRAGHDARARVGHDEPTSSAGGS